MKKVRLCILCVIAAVCNSLLNTLIEQILGLPLFMDTLFTIAVTLMAGPLWGIITAVLTTLIIGLLYYDFWGTYLYVFCSIATVLLVELFRRIFSRIENPMEEMSKAPENFTRSRFTRRVTMLLLLSISMTALMSILGGAIAFMISSFLRRPSHDSISPEFFFRLGLLRQNVPILAADILARIPVNIVDRLISVFGAFSLSLGLKKTLR